MKLQIALDLDSADKAVAMAAQVYGLVDIIELGTPLMLKEGVGVVGLMKRRFPDALILADMKIADGGYMEARFAVEEGADNGVVERDSTGGSGAFVGGGCSQDSSDCAGKTTEDSSLQVVESQDLSTTEKLSGWQWNGLSWYYYLDGCRLTGMQNIDDSLYYLDPARDGAMSCGWIFTENKWYYAGPSGALASGWQFIGGQWYWFDSLDSCSMATGRRVIDGHPYLLGTYGLINGWCLDNGLWYWGNNGEVLTGWFQTSNNWYWLDPANDGVMSRGIVSVGSSLYYLSDSGAMAVGWAFDGTDWYYADGSGALASGWRLVNGVWYWLDVANDNRMATGFYVIGSNRYHFSSTGALSLGWFMSNGDWYYAEPSQASGIIKTEWLKDGGQYYYLDPTADGKMLLDHFSVNGKSYYAKASGAVACREWVDVQDSVQDEPSKAFAGSDCSLCGALRNGKLFTSNGDGELVEAHGFVMLGGCKFYADPTDGSPCAGWKNVNGKWYFFDETAGYARSGWLYKDGSWFYLDPSTYAMKTGWVAVNGSWYYLNSSGFMQTGWLNLGGTWYWLDASGAMATGWRVVDGSWNYFMANGAWVSDYMDAKAQSYSSNTNWLILVDTSRCITSIYTGSWNNWSLNRRYVCSTGKASTPTVIGEYQVYGKGYSFGHGYTCYYYTQFYGDYLFHSSPYYVNSNRVMDPTMGVPSSAGCVRLEIQNAKWIYDNIPYGTKVVTY